MASLNGGLVNHTLFTNAPAITGQSNAFGDNMPIYGNASEQRHMA